MLPSLVVPANGQLPHEKKILVSGPNTFKMAGVAGIVSHRVWGVLVVIIVFLVFAGLMSILLYHFPTVPIDQRAHVRIPTTVDEAKVLGRVLGATMRTDDASFWIVVASFMIVYSFFQAFSIPGSTMLSVLAGALFGLVPGVLSVAVCCSIGATLCYLMSSAIGQSFLFGDTATEAMPGSENLHGTTQSSTTGTTVPDEYTGDKITAGSSANRSSSSSSSNNDSNGSSNHGQGSASATMKVKLAAVRAIVDKLQRNGHLMICFILARLSPVPNWLVNAMSCHVGVDLWTFVVGTFVGVIPLTVIPVQAGLMLQQLSSTAEMNPFSPKNVGVVVVGAAFVLGSAYVSRWAARRWRAIGN